MSILKNDLNRIEPNWFGSSWWLIVAALIEMEQKSIKKGKQGEKQPLTDNNSFNADAEWRENPTHRSIILVPAFLFYVPERWKDAGVLRGQQYWSQVLGGSLKAHTSV